MSNQLCECACTGKLTQMYLKCGVCLLRVCALSKEDGTNENFSKFFVFILFLGTVEFDVHLNY